MLLNIQNSLTVLTVIAAFAAVALAADKPCKQGGNEGNGGYGRGQGNKKQPNIIFILVDDQDAVHDSSRFMPNLQKYIAGTGVTFENHFVVHPVCCPSRTNIFRSQCSHNTNMTNVFAPYGGYTKFRQQNLDDDYLPVWLQNLGYWTGYAGKFLVEYGLINYQQYPKGWDDFDSLVFPYTFDYMNPAFSRNGEYPVSFAGQYTTDVVSNKTLNMIDEAHASGKPWFIMTAPVGPHTQMVANNTCLQHFVDTHGGNATGVTGVAGFYCTVTSDPLPAPRHQHLFNEETIPRSPSFNQQGDMSSYPNWLRFQPALSAQNISRLDEHYRNRLRSLQSIDEMIGAIFAKLDDIGDTQDTYVFYSSDNGFHLGAHRMMAGKETTFEDDIRTPMFVTGPGISRTNITARTLHIDIAPTIVALAGGEHPRISDGQVMPVPGVNFDAKITERVSFGTAFWGAKLDEDLILGGSFTPQEIGLLAKGMNVAAIYQNFTWRGIRVEKEGHGAFKYAVFCDGPNDHELYDLNNDPHELINIYSQYAKTNQTFLDRLDAHLTVANTCKSSTCVNPTSYLHPNGDAKDFFDTLNPKFDAQYAAYPKFMFQRCLGYPEVTNEIGFINMTFVAPDGSNIEKSQLAGAVVSDGSPKDQEWYTTHHGEAETGRPLSREVHDMDMGPLMYSAPFIYH